VRFELFIGVVEEALDGSFPDGAIQHSTSTFVHGWFGLVRRCSMPWRWQV
jgi:hypothetical protein